MSKLVLFFFVLFSYLPAYAGEADSPEQALLIIADKIEAGDLAGVLKYFSNGNGKNESVLRLIINDTSAHRKTIAEPFRHTHLKSRSFLEGYEGAKPGDEYRTYSMALEKNGTSHETEIALCGNGHNWYVCNW